MTPACVSFIAFIDTTAMVSASNESPKRMEFKRESKAKPGSGALGFPTKRDQAAEKSRDAKADATDAAYAKRILNDPDTEWVDWDDVKRELASQGRLGGSPR